MRHYTPDIPKLMIYFSADEPYRTNCYSLKKTVREAVRATLYHEKFDFDTVCDIARRLSEELEYSEENTEAIKFEFVFGC